jgi:iron complex transport system ATP-binding protein
LNAGLQAGVRDTGPRGGDPSVPALALTDVSVEAWDRRAAVRHRLLSDISWTVRAGEHWAVLGPNGAGKTTLLAAVTGRLPPISGTIAVLGKPIGSPGMRDPRQHLGLVEATSESGFASRMSPLDVVLHAIGGSVAAQGRRPSPAERGRAADLLRRLGCGPLLDRRHRDCSQGERQRVMIARALMRRPRLLLLDEPTSGLDLPAREGLLHAMRELARTMPALATVTVTHHVEELATSTTHALLLRGGRIVAAGPVDEALTEASLTQCFGLPVSVSRPGGRWAARSARPPGW